ncbi:MAG: hypothetical protein OHK0021_00920 [Bryobacter sp.]
MVELNSTALFLRIGIFAFAAILTLQIGALALGWTGVILRATLSVFAAAAVANTIALRVFERASFTRIGLGWHAAALRHLGWGLLGGLLSAALVTALPALTPLASYQHTTSVPFHAPSLGFVAGALLFGAIGEELLFHGYAFQLLMGSYGAFTTLLPVGVLFAAAHSNNLASNPLSLFNTFLWGVFLGLCFFRAGDLWLPIGVHYGWNLALMLGGAQVSGFQLSATGYQLVWHTPDWLGGGAYGPEGGLLCTLVLPLLGWFLYRAPIDTQRPGLLSSPEE